jgi:hypothetical protein
MRYWMLCVNMSPIDIFYFGKIVLYCILLFLSSDCNFFSNIHKWSEKYWVVDFFVCFDYHTWIIYMDFSHVMLCKTWSVDPINCHGLLLVTFPISNLLYDKSGFRKSINFQDCETAVLRSTILKLDILF